jgi:predicted Zn-dependent protease
MADISFQLQREAQTSWKLGRYAEAHLQFKKALENTDSLSIAVDAAGMFMEQGCAQRALETIDDGLNRLSERTVEQDVVATAEALQAATTAMCTARFSDPLKTFERLYYQHKLGTSVEQCNNRLVSTLRSKRFVESFLNTFEIDHSLGYILEYC